MIQPSVNPWGLLGTFVTPGLNAIQGTLPVTTVDQLVNALYGNITTTFYTGTLSNQQQIEIKSVCYAAVNNYNNNLVLGGQAGYNAKQMALIELLIGSSMIAGVPMESIADRISDVENNLTDSGLTVKEQEPIFMATTIGTNVYNYWLAQMPATGPAPWTPYIPTAPQNIKNYMDLAYYTVAAMSGALAGYGATPEGMVEPTINVVSTRMISAFIGGLIATSGKVIFNWIPRIQKPLTLNAETVANLNNKKIDTAFTSIFHCKSKHCAAWTGDPGSSIVLGSAPCEILLCADCTGVGALPYGYGTNPNVAPM